MWHVTQTGKVTLNDLISVSVVLSVNALTFPGFSTEALPQPSPLQERRRGRKSTSVLQIKRSVNKLSVLPDAQPFGYFSVSCLNWGFSWGDCTCFFYAVYSLSVSELCPAKLACSDKCLISTSLRISRSFLCQVASTNKHQRLLIPWSVFCTVSLITYISRVTRANRANERRTFLLWLMRPPCIRPAACPTFHCSWEQRPERGCFLEAISRGLRQTEAVCSNMGR